MAVSRVIYGIVLLGCSAFYIGCGVWFSWLLLLGVLIFPWLSLAISLGAMLRFQASPAGPEILLAGTAGELWLVGSCPLPMPPFRGQLRLTSCITGAVCRYRPEKGLNTGHCGAYVAVVEKARVYDYLGLFSFPLLHKGSRRILVRPVPVSLQPMPDLQKLRAHRWRPKSGGGYAENHELRLYRPGDSMNQVHWKLTAKTRKLMLREPQEPQRGLVLLTLNHRGTPEELDRKLGRLIWLGSGIVRQQIPFEVRALTGEGLLSFSVQTEEDLQSAVDTLLGSPLAGTGDIRDHGWVVSWQYHIGGKPDA